MTVDIIWKAAMAIIGCFAAAYIGLQLIGGGLTGWIAGIVILIATCGPLVKVLYDRNIRR